MKRWIVAAVLLVVFFAILLFVRRQIDVEKSAVEAVVEKAVGRQETRVDLTVILTELSNLSRLETARMKIAHMSRLEQSYGIIPNMLAGDELTLMAVGEVIGGVDLTKLGPDDIFRGKDDVVTIRLPASEILISRIDNNETNVVDRKTGLFRSQDTGLEGRARAYAEEQIRLEAVRKGILDLATTNAEEQLAELVTKLGAETVRFVRHELADPEDLAN